MFWLFDDETDFVIAREDLYEMFVTNRPECMVSNFSFSSLNVGGPGFLELDGLIKFDGDNLDVAFDFKKLYDSKIPFYSFYLVAETKS